MSYAYVEKFLEDLDTASQRASEPDGEVFAYRVDVSNPVCPHCGAKLVIVNDVDPGEAEELVDVNESWRDDRTTIQKWISEAARELYEEWAKSQTQHRRYSDEQTEWLREAVSRKAAEMKSLLNSVYGIEIDSWAIETDLLEAIHFMKQKSEIDSI